MTINNKHELGDIVYHRVDNTKGMVIGIVIGQDGIRYSIQWSASNNQWNYECELSSEPCPEWDIVSDSRRESR